MRYSIVGLCLVLIFAGDGIKSTSAQEFGTCKTPSGNDGSCIPVADCTPLYTLLEKGSVTDDERTLLQASQCGYSDNKYLVCCPKVESFDDRISVGSNLLPRIPSCPIDFKNRIVGGHDTDFDDFIWLARIEYRKPDGSTGFHCGGSLINDQYVLTAAHCVKGRIPEGWVPISVRLGEWDTNSNPDCVSNGRGKKDCADEYVDVAIKTITTHPHYLPSSRNQHHDIALLRLTRKVKKTNFIAPICLPQQETLRNELFERLVLDVSGWGVTETENSSQIKQTTNLTVWNFNDCRNKYITQKIQLMNGQMCAGGVQGVDSCSGDSGGPLFYKHNEGRPYYFLAGIVSFGPSICGQPGWPGVYTRVGQYMDWIQGNVLP